jgi:hypothetical protein
MRFSQYILESNGDFVLNEKLGNLNASNDPKYNFLLKTILQNKAWRGNLVGPNSKIVTLTGKGRSQFIKDLRDVQKKIGDPQLIFLTTEYKTLMIKNADQGKWDDDLGDYAPNPVNAHLQTIDFVVSNNHMGSVIQGPALPKTEIEQNVLSAKGNPVIRRLKNSLDNAALNDDAEYHAIVILPDLGNVGKAAQRNRNKTGGDKYAVGSSGTTRFMNGAKYDAENLRYERAKAQIGYELKWMTIYKARDFIFDGNTTVTIDGVTYKKDPYRDDLGCTFTKNGDLKLIELYDDVNYKQLMLVYNFRTEKFTIENKW